MVDGGIGGAVIGLGSDLCHNEHIPVKNKDRKNRLKNDLHSSMFEKNSSFA